MTSQRTELVVLVPVLRRPHRVRPLLDSVSKTAEARVLFIADPDDDQELEVLEREGAEFITLASNYPGKINHGIRETTEPLIFLGADDLHFRSGWFEAAKAKLTGRIGVVGTADLIDRRRDHSTHFLVTREYAERGQIDGEAGLLCEAYDHSFVDDELIATATARGAYAFTPDAIVEHVHWMNGQAPDDEVYRKGRENFRLDRKRFRRRSAQWT